jgi:hypothetical protein
VIDELEAGAKKRFVRWDAALWRSIVDGPARELGAALGARGGEGGEGGETILRTYLELACEAIGLGLLFPATATGADNFFTLAWTRLVPRGLAAQPPAKRAEILASLWNLGENLEQSPAWLRRIFLRLCDQSKLDLGQLEELVARVAARAVEPPAQRLGKDGEQMRVSPHWIHLAGEDPRFLPGALHFVAPLVVCVHDRLRTGGGGRDAATIGVWLGADPPMSLGAMGCKEDVQRTSTITAQTTASLAQNDLRFGDPWAAARNEWAAAITLETSQLLLALLPVPVTP